MVRYRLTNFLNKHINLQAFILVVMLMSFLTYIFAFGLDAYNLVLTATVNSQLIEDDSDLIQIDEYELENTTITIDEETYKDISIVFYGITTDDDTVYFNPVNKTLIQSIPNNFGVSFLISSNAFIVLVSFLCVCCILTFIYKSKNLKLNALTFQLCCAFWVLFAITVVGIFVVYLVLL